MTMYLRRRATFSAGLNRPLPGDPGRGHDYLCELTVGGSIDPNTGMVINIKDVDAVLKRRVTGPLGGKLLDTEVAAFRESPATPENITRYLWDECLEEFGTQAYVARITLWPNLLLKIDLSTLESPHEAPMLTVTRSYDFSASHRLHSLALSDTDNAEVFGKCNWENGHGHNYEFEVTLTGEVDPQTGQLLNLDRLDEIVDKVVLKPYDHKHLNYDTEDFRTLNPTSENLTKVIWDNLFTQLSSEPLGGARLYRIAVRETARNYFEYYGD